MEFWRKRLVLRSFPLFLMLETPILVFILASASALVFVLVFYPGGLVARSPSICGG